MIIEQTSYREDDVRDLAYRLWEEAGQPEGRRDEFWYEAHRRLGASADGAHRSTPPEPADPHPADEDRDNVFNPAPGIAMVSEQHSTDLEADPENPGSPA